MNPIIILRVAYMDRYDGPAKMHKGGKNPEKLGIGGEIYNFLPSQGIFYGYASLPRDAGIDLKKAVPNYNGPVGEEFNGLDVVFIATRPSGGQVVIGWYLNATAFNKQPD